MTLGEYIAEQVRRALDEWVKDNKSTFIDIVDAGGNTTAHGIVGDVGSVVSIITDVIGTIPVIGGLLDEPVRLLEDVDKAAGNAGQGFGAGYLLGYAGFQLLDPYIRMVQHAVEDLAQSQIFDPATAADLAARGIITEGFARSEAGGSGFDGTHEDQMIDAAQTRPDVITLLTLLNRGLTTEGEVDGALHRLGYQPNWRESLKGLRRALLSPADLALAFLRTEITREEMLDYAKLLGVDEGDMTTLVNNTGEPPGLMQMLEGYRRGFIDKATLERGIRQSRVRDEWIPLVERLRFEPMGTADAVRAVVENYLPDAEGKKIAEQNGLEPDHWEVLRESWGRPLAHEQMMQLFYRGQATEEQVKQAFRESDLKDKYIQQAFDLGRKLVPERIIIQMLDRGVVTHARATEMLKQQGYNDQDAEALIRLGAANRNATRKALTRTDIVSMYTDALMTHSEAIKHLTALGYSSEDAEDMLKLADAKVKAAQTKQLETGVRASFRAHHMTRQEAINELEAHGLDSKQANQLLDLWTVERGNPTHGLTEAQIIKLAEDRFISPENALQRLQAYGLVFADAVLLLRLHGVYGPPAPGPPPPPALPPLAPQTPPTLVGEVGPGA